MCANIKKLLKKKLYCQTYMGHSKTALDERQSVNKGEFRFPILNFSGSFSTAEVACVASVSSRGSSRKLGQEQKKKKNERRRSGRGTKEPLARKPQASHAGSFRGARISSLPTNACSTEDNIPFPRLANHVVLSKFWKVDLDRRVTR